MKEGFDIYKIKEQLEKAISEIKKLPDTTNKKLVCEYVKHIQFEGKKSVPRLVREVTILHWFLQNNHKDVDDMDVPQIIQFMQHVKSKKQNPATYNVYMKVIRRFIKWRLEYLALGESSLNKRMKLEFKISQMHKYIKQLPEKELKFRSTELLTIDDVAKLINTEPNPMYKCLLGLLYSSGARIGEILSLQIKDVLPRENGYDVLVEGKTNHESAIPIIDFAFTLETWLLSHPFRNEPDSPLFANKDGAILFHPNVYRHLKRLAKKAGIDKRVNPHFFRHSEASRSAQYLTQAESCLKHGWIQGSRVLRRYYHIDGENLRNKEEQARGLASEKKQELQQTEIKCPRCLRPNPKDALVCCRCGQALSEEKLKEIGDRNKAIIEKFGQIEPAQLQLINQAIEVFQKLGFVP